MTVQDSTSMLAQYCWMWIGRYITRNHARVVSASLNRIRYSSAWGRSYLPITYCAITLCNRPHIEEIWSLGRRMDENFTKRLRSGRTDLPFKWLHALQFGFFGLHQSKFYFNPLYKSTPYILPLLKLHRATRTEFVSDRIKNWAAKFFEFWKFRRWNVELRKTGWSSFIALALLLSIFFPLLFAFFFLSKFLETVRLLHGGGVTSLKNYLGALNTY